MGAGSGGSAGDPGRGLARTPEAIAAESAARAEAVAKRRADRKAASAQLREQVGERNDDHLIRPRGCRPKIPRP